MKLRVKSAENNIVYRTIVSAYINGATEISVEVEDVSLLKEAIKQAKEATSRLIGLEIVDQSLDRIVLQTFTDIRSHDVPSLVNRSLKFLISMIKHLGENQIDIKFLEDIENEMNKLQSARHEDVNNESRSLEATINSPIQTVHEP